MAAVTAEVGNHSRNGVALKINVTVKNQDGYEVFFRIPRASQLEKLMDSYCERVSRPHKKLAFSLHGRFLKREETPQEVRMEDGDEINVHDADQIMSTFTSRPSHIVQEGSNAIKQQCKGEDTCKNEDLDNYTFDELVQEANHSFMQAMSYVKAYFHKAKQLAEDARKLTRDDETKMLSELCNAKIETVKILAGRNLMIGQIHEELKQANAETSTVSRKQSELGEVLGNVKRHFCEEVEYSGSAAMEESHNELKRAHLHGPSITNHFPEHEDAAQNDMTDKVDYAQLADHEQHLNIKFIGQLQMEDGAEIQALPKESDGL